MSNIIVHWYGSGRLLRSTKTFIKELTNEWGDEFRVFCLGPSPNRCKEVIPFLYENRLFVAYCRHTCVVVVEADYLNISELIKLSDEPLSELRDLYYFSDFESYMDTEIKKYIEIKGS